MRWYLIIGALAGFCLWLAIPIVFGLPSFILTHSGDSELHALGHRIIDATGAFEAAWTFPMDVGEQWATTVGATGLLSDLILILATYGVPLAVGAAAGLVVWAAVVLVQSIREERAASAEGRATLLTLAKRFTNWLMVALVAAFIPFLIAAFAEWLGAPSVVVSFSGVLGMVLVVLAPLAAAFLFGRLVRDEHLLSASEAALVAAGGVALAFLYLELAFVVALLTGEDWPDLELIVDSAHVLVLGWLITASGAALGAWWQTRHPHSEPFRPPEWRLDRFGEQLGLAAAWLFAGYVAAAVAVGGVVMLTGSVLRAVDLVTSDPRGILLTGMLLIPLLIFAFISGHQMRRHHGLTVRQTALAMLLGMAVITAMFGLWDRADLFGQNAPDPERIPHYIIMLAVVWALTVAVGTLGARSTSPAPDDD